MLSFWLPFGRVGPMYSLQSWFHKCIELLIVVCIVWIKVTFRSSCWRLSRLTSPSRPSTLLRLLFRHSALLLSLSWSGCWGDSWRLRRIYILFKEEFLLLWFRFWFLNLCNILFKHVLSSKPISKFIVVWLTWSMFWALSNWWEPWSAFKRGGRNSLFCAGNTVGSALDPAWNFVLIRENIHRILLKRFASSLSVT